MPVVIIKSRATSKRRQRRFLLLARKTPNRFFRSHFKCPRHSLKIKKETSAVASKLMSPTSFRLGCVVRCPCDEYFKPLVEELIRVGLSKDAINN